MDMEADKPKGLITDYTALTMPKESYKHLQYPKNMNVKSLATIRTEKMDNAEREKFSRRGKLTFPSARSS